VAGLAKLRCKLVTNSPALIVMSPVKELAPDSVSEPAPCFVKLPGAPSSRIGD